MKPADHPPGCGCPLCLAHTVTQLLTLRDALVGLSLALCDWQFEIDELGRRDALAATRQLIEQMGSTHGP